MARVLLGVWCGLIVLWGCAEEDGRQPFDEGGSSDGDGDTDSDNGPGGDTAQISGSGQWADGIHVDRLEANQGVAVNLSVNGNLIAPGSRNAGLIRGRTTLVRAFWSLDSAWRPRDILAYLSLQRPDGTQETFQDHVYVDGPPDPERMDGAFHWLIDASIVQAGTTYSVELKETASSDLGTADPGLGARIPADGFADMGIIDAPMTLKIVLVPFAPPGGGAVPVTDPDRADVEEALFELSPVQNIQVSWAAPRTQSLVYQNTDEAWDEVYATRNALGLGPDEYCHVLLNPDGCCNMGAFGFTGIGGTPGAGQSDYDARNRSAIIMVEKDVGSSALSVVHELGHNQGLSHADCGDVTDVDRNFPYNGGAVGTQGYGILTGELHSGNPNIDYPYFDVMSYCWPLWYSDYNFEKIRERIQIVSSWGL